MEKVKLLALASGICPISFPSSLFSHFSLLISHLSPLVSHLLSLISHLSPPSHLLLFSSHLSHPTSLLSSLFLPIVSPLPLFYFSEKPLPRAAGIYTLGTSEPWNLTPHHPGQRDILVALWSQYKCRTLLFLGNRSLRPRESSKTAQCGNGNGGLLPIMG